MMPPTAGSQRADLDASVRVLRTGQVNVEPGPSTTWSRVTLAGIVALGLVLRAIPVVGNAWPVGDGGLFYAMVGDLVRNGLALPAFTSYAHEAIPFAYPPLALEFAAALELATGVARSDLFRWLPLAFSVLCIPAVYLVALEVLGDRRRAQFATVAYATFPYAWEWLTMGSGVTRSAGMFFALLATWQGLRLLSSRSRRSALSTGVFAGLAVLSHPEAAVFVAIALGARLLASWSWRGLRRLALAAIVAAVVAAPWALVVVQRHGIAPFLAAGGGVGRDPVASIVVYVFGFLVVSPLPIVPVLDALGQIRDVLARRPYLVLWRLALCLLDLRFALVSAVVPLSMLAADGLFGVVVPAAQRFASSWRDGRASRLAAPGIVGVVSAGLVASGLLAPSVFLAPHVALSTADRAAMHWVRATQPADRRFLVLATDTWGSDDLSEWFPALSAHATLDTSQGLEWGPPAVRDAEMTSEAQLRACQPADVVCLGRWIAAHSGGDAGVYVPADGSAFVGTSDPSARVRAALLSSPSFRLIYDGPGADVFVPAPGTSVVGSP